MIEHTPTAVITGGSSGLGAAAVDYFVQHGWSVAALDLTDAEPSERVTRIHVDVADPNSVNTAVDTARNDLGSIDALVHCAGVNTVGALLDTSNEDWYRCMHINADGTFHMMAAVLPVMIAAGGGAIVNVSSITASRSMRSVAAYSASKGAVTAMTLSVARDYAKDGIRANVVQPATFDSPMVRRTFAARDSDVEVSMARSASAYPLGRLGRPADVVPMLHFLVSHESDWITGAVYGVDGGLFSVAGL